MTDSESASRLAALVGPIPAATVSSPAASESTPAESEWGGRTSPTDSFPTDTPPADAPPTPPSRGGGLGVVVGLTALGLPLAGIVLLFLPLGAAGIEQALWQTNRVESLCHDLGIHDFLSSVYRPVLSWLEPWLR